MNRLFRLGLSAICLWLCTSFHAASAQSAAELSATLKQVTSQLKPVSGASQSYQQTFSFETLRPYLVELAVKSTDSKGQSTATTYTFNLADIDPETIAFEAKKELMVITAKTRDKQAFINQKENDVQKNNTSQFTVYGTDVDNARTLVDLLRKAAPLANKQFLADVRLPETYDGLIKWISNNLDSTPSSTESLQQSAEMDKTNPLLLKLVQVRTEKGKGSEQLYQFNVADLNPQRVNLDVTGSVIAVLLENKNRFIRSRKNGQWEKNTISASTLCLTAHKARMMQLAWQKLIPLSAKQLEGQQARFSQYGSLSDGLKRISATVQPIEDGTDHIDQQLEPACMTTLSVKASGRKTVDETYRFHWSDMDGTNTKLRSDGGGFLLEIPGKDKGKWITTTRNGQRGAYESSIEIRSNDLETLRFIPALLQKLIPECQKTISATLPAGGMGWVADKITGLQDPKGQMTYQLKKGEDNCTYTFTSRQNTGKKINELSWDLKLADLDPQAVKINISGSELTIDLATNGKAKIMKAYKDGQPGSYASQVSLVINDLEIARPMTEIWKQSITGCRR